MKNLMRCLMALVALASGCILQGQVSITATGTYAQDFDTLITSSSATWTDNSTLTHWYAQRSTAGTTIIAGAGTSTTGGLYSFGTGINSDRALGTVGGGASGGSFAYGIVFQNNSGSTATLGTLSYVGEQWRNSAAAAQSITVWYQISSSSITNFGPGNDIGWTSLSALDFTSPITGGAAGSLDGNLTANRVSLSSSLTSITLTSGQYFAVRFSDIDHSGSDHALGIDDFSLSYTVAAIPEPSTYAAIVGAVALVGVVIHRRRKLHPAG